MTSSSLPPDAAAYNTPRQVAVASMIGTAIEFYDYYIYVNAAVLVFGAQFFPKSDGAAATLLSLSTLSLAFFARPIGSALFGHFGDRVGRKRTLVASLLTMGLSTMAIGLLPTYDQAGLWAPLLLCLCRVGQGIGLGGEWGGAALVATENAPQGKRGLFGAFPQLGAPVGLFAANAVFFLVSHFLGTPAMAAWGWRIPFVLSVVLVGVGLYVRLNLHESLVFHEAETHGKTLRAPVTTAVSRHWRAVVLGSLVMVATYALFYLMTAFVQVYSKSPAALSAAGHPTGLGIPANTFTAILLGGAIVFGICTVIGGVMADRFGRRNWLIGVTAAIIAFGLALSGLLGGAQAPGVLLVIVIGLALMGFTYGPMAALLPELFPTEVRYSGASLAYNFGSVIGASVPTLIALKLNESYGLWGVGVYLCVNGAVTLLALLFSKETREVDLAAV